MNGDSVEVLCFFVGQRVFAVDIMGIREILRSHAVTPVPTAPEAVSGVINLRGELLPVVNLHRVLLQVTSEGVHEDAKLVVVRAGGRTAGLQVDQVLEVVSVSGEELSPLPGGTAAGKAVVAGFRRDLDGAGPVLVLLLRLAVLLEEAGIEGAAGGSV